MEFPGNKNIKADVKFSRKRSAKGGKPFASRSSPYFAATAKAGANAKLGPPGKRLSAIQILPSGPTCGMPLIEQVSPNDGKIANASTFLEIVVAGKSIYHACLLGAFRQLSLMGSFANNPRSLKTS
jgi:hypothetical protein